MRHATMSTMLVVASTQGKKVKENNSKQQYFFVY